MQFKALIHSKLLEKNRQEILKMTRGLKKIDYFELQNEEFGLKDFFKTLTLSQGRTKFSILTNMIPAKMNYMSDPAFSKALYECDCKEGLLSSTRHFKFCKKFDFLRLNIDWTNDQQVIEYFQQALKLEEG